MLKLFKPDGTMATHLIIGLEEYEVGVYRSARKITYVWSSIIENGMGGGCRSIKKEDIPRYTKEGWHYVETF